MNYKLLSIFSLNYVLLNIQGLNNFNAKSKIAFQIMSGSRYIFKQSLVLLEL